MAPRIHNVPSGRLKKRTDEVEETMFQGIEKSFELILCILWIGKLDLWKVA
jgi:hypothetical protein